MPAPPRGPLTPTLATKRKSIGMLGTEVRLPRAQTIGTDTCARQKCQAGEFSSRVCATMSMVKKSRYMSKFAAIFAASDNTQLNCTQPIANSLTMRL
jgi:hypothetical protein